MSRIKYGDEHHGTEYPNFCPDCGTIKGGYHDLGCDVEQCDTCGGQRISCECHSVADTRYEALTMVIEERDRQDAKWGQQDHTPAVWVGILGEEFGEYCQAVNETVFDNGPQERAKGGIENMKKELSHVAAVAVAHIECLIRNVGEG